MVGPPNRDQSPGPSRILIVDDEDSMRRTLARVIESFGHETEQAADGIAALAMLPLEFDLVMLDAEMPNMDGFEVATRIREDPEYGDLPIMMVTGFRRKEDQLRAVEVGINDFVNKPPEMEELRLRTESLLKLKRATDALRQHEAELESLVERRTAALRKALDDVVEARRQTHVAHLDTIRRLVLTAEFKERDTGAHIERIGLLAELIAKEAGIAPREVEIIRHAAPMHDVGKIGTPDSVLLKPGPLNDEEWEIMRRHTSIGARILSGSPSEILQAGAIIALSHHEKWDGSGYPLGLSGEDIPLAGRICAVVDVFDALTSDRHYRGRGPIPNEEAYDMMKKERGKHFDPEVLGLFLANQSRIEEIKKECQDLPDEFREETEQ